MKLPPELIKYDGQPPDGPDEALVKMGTMKRWIAASIGLIPKAGSGIRIRRSDSGDVWTAEGGGGGEDDSTPWRISRTGHINPAFVGSKMPTLGGESLLTTSNVLDMSTDGYVYFKLNFTVGWVESYLASWSLTSVSVEQGSLPSDDADTKHLAFNYLVGGVAAWGSFFNQSISVRLLDHGISATILDYNP